MVRRNGQDVISGSGFGEPTEYFCTKCLQLRLSLIADKSHCRNCNSKEIIIGKVGTLDKSALIKQFTSYED